MRGTERRQQILECAAEAFAEGGYHGTSVADIVERAKVARGTLYQYFPDKRSIFGELLEGFMRDLRARIPPVPHSVGAAVGIERVRQNVRAVLELMLERRSLTKILLSEAVGLDEDFDKRLLDFYAEVRGLLEGSLRFGQQVGVVRACDTRLAAIFTLGAIKELLYEVAMRGYRPDVETLMQEFLPHITTGLLVAEPVGSG